MCNELSKEIHQNAVDHGWWEEGRSFGDIIALCHSELSEALEEYRDGKSNLYFDCAVDDQDPDCVCEPRHPGCGQYYTNDCGYRGRKPEGIAIELADCIIRILDYCSHAGIDIDEAIRIKHEYNKNRPYRHGGKVI
jgi:NTP pyrophosphatase (non-canonical NTP hydrolase)